MKKLLLPAVAVLFLLSVQQAVAQQVRKLALDEVIRLAEELIKTTDLNISEIVYTVGLTSRSYFCKIFKSFFC